MITIAPLIKAFCKFEEFRQHGSTEQERAGTIQAFEYCFELSWKTMRRLLAERGVITNSPRETFRMAAADGMIRNVEVWFDFVKKRNLTVHTYNEDEVMSVLTVCEAFAQEVAHFIDFAQRQT